MPIKNNDDVMHLLEATGRTGASYREFEGPADQASAPLIDAVFATAPPEPGAGHQQPLPTGPAKTDLLSEVFDRPSPIAAPAPPPPATSQPASAPPRHGIPATGRAAPASAMGDVEPAPTSGPRRSLSDIRRVIARPAEQAAKAPPTDSLNGLFDRLAG